LSIAAIWAESAPIDAVGGAAMAGVHFAAAVVAAPRAAGRE
jgi:hypothetical protein